MTDTASNNKRIAKNTMFLYIRMLFLMFISFFTSRILLKELGVEDYGIYNVVGSVVAIFSSIQGLLASSTQRFLNFAHGKGDRDQLNKIFSMSVWIHVGLSLIFLVVILPIGLFIIKNYLTIPEERLTAAYWVFVFSIFSAIVTIMTVPYNAVIIANERMSAFAYISILDGVLRLGIIYLLIYTVFDQLITYAVLLFAVGLIVRLVNMFYCHRKFEEAKKIVFVWDKKLFKQMGSFAGWQFLGNSGWALQQQGLNMILNVFFGPALNAARGLANQVNGGLLMFVNNMMLAVNPQVTKLYAAGKNEQLYDIFFRSSKYSFMLFSILIFPFFLSAEFMLDLWLTVIPAHTITFIKLVLIYSAIRVLHMPIDTLLKASGSISKYQFFDFTFLIMTLPITYTLFKHGRQPESMFLAMICMQIIATGVALYLCKKRVGLSLKLYFLNVIFPCMLIVFSFILLICISIYINMYLLLKILVLTGFFLIALLYIGFSNNERNSVYNYLKNKLH